MYNQALSPFFYSFHVYLEEDQILLNKTPYVDVFGGAKTHTCIEWIHVKFKATTFQHYFVSRLSNDERSSSLVKKIEALS